MRFLEKMLLPLLGIILLSFIAKGQCDSSSIVKSKGTRIIKEQCYQSIVTEYNALQDYKTSSDSTIASMKRELSDRTKIGIALSKLENNCYQLSTDLALSNQKLSELALQNNSELFQCKQELAEQITKSNRNFWLGGGLVLTIEIAGAVGYYFLSR
jgi:hypothetical protein